MEIQPGFGHQELLEGRANLAATVRSWILHPGRRKSSLAVWRLHKDTVLEACGQGSEGQRKDRGVGQPKILQAPPRQENRCKLWWANARQVESHLDKQLTQGVQTSLRPSFKHIESREHGRELMGPRGGPSQRGPLEWMGPLKRRWVNYLHLSLIDHCFPRRNQ